MCPGLRVQQGQFKGTTRVKQGNKWPPALCPGLRIQKGYIKGN